MADSSNRWKILSIALMVILAAGFLAPKAFALNQTDLPQAIMTVVLQIKSLLTNSQYGLQAISNKVSAGANQTSINHLQATANAIKAKTDNLPARPASVVDVVNSTNVITRDANFDRCAATTIAPYANLEGCDLSFRDLRGANLSYAVLDKADFQYARLDGTNFDHAGLSGADFTGCTGSPTGTPDIGSLPTCS